MALRLLVHLGRGCATVAMVTGAPIDPRVLASPVGDRDRDSRRAG